MAIQTEPTRIQIPFADSGTKNVIPDTNSTPSASQAASWTDGFPAQCSLPLSAGGIPPARADFNGILNTMSQSIRFGQEGGVWAWDATVDYAANRAVLGSDGLLYWSVAQSGPNVGGAQDPTTDTSHTYWISPKFPTTPDGDSSACAATTQWVNQWWTSNRTLPSNLYLDAVNGDDSYDGFSWSTAKKTITAMETLIGNRFYTKPSTCRVHVASGTYSNAIYGVFGVNIVYDFGNSGAIINGAYLVGSGKTVNLTGTFTTKAKLHVVNGATLILGEDSSSVAVTFDNINDTSVLCAQSLGILLVSYGSSSVSIQLSGTNTVSLGVVYVDSLSQITTSFVNGVISWSGGVTGRKYYVAALGAFIGTGPIANIPGTTGYQDPLGHIIN